MMPEIEISNYQIFFKLFVLVNLVCDTARQYESSVKQKSSCTFPVCFVSKNLFSRQHSCITMKYTSKRHPPSQGVKILR